MKQLNEDNGVKPRVVFTEAVLAKIPLWIIDGWTLDKIAEHIGTSQGSLLATCSRLGISLKGAKQPKGKKRAMDELVLRLPKPLSEKLETRALDLSISTEHLVIVLLGQIASDDLFDAILDFDDLDEDKT
jgi:hypothetical protein